MSLGSSPIAHGSNQILRVNGRFIGYVSNFTWNQSQGQKKTFVVDSPFPAEIAQGAAPSMVTGSMTVFKLNNTSLEEAGMIGERTPKGSPITATTHLGAARYSVMEIVDRQTKATVVKFNQVMFASQAWRIMSKDVVTGVVSFEAMLSNSSGDEGSISVT